MPNVNPEILRWARVTAGLAEEEAVEKLKLRKYDPKVRKHVDFVERKMPSPKK